MSDTENPNKPEEQAADQSADQAGGEQAPAGSDLDLAELQEGAGASGEEAGLEAVYDIPVTVKAVLGSSHMHIHQLLKLGRGAVVELDRKVGDAVDIYVNDRLVARGEVVIVEDKLGVTMTEIVKSNH